MTYAQMFQEIAGRYDLDWRQLAAQGYVRAASMPWRLAARDRWD